MTSTIKIYHIKSKMSKSEVLIIIVVFHLKSYRNLKRHSLEMCLEIFFIDFAMLKGYHYKRKKLL